MPTKTYDNRTVHETNATPTTFVVNHWASSGQHIDVFGTILLLFFEQSDITVQQRRRPDVRIHFLVVCCGRCKRLCNCHTHCWASNLVCHIFFAPVREINSNRRDYEKKATQCGVLCTMSKQQHSLHWTRGSLMHGSDLWANNFCIGKLTRTGVLNRMGFI